MLFRIIKLVIEPDQTLKGTYDCARIVIPISNLECDAVKERACPYIFDSGDDLAFHVFAGDGLFTTQAKRGALADGPLRFAYTIGTDRFRLLIEKVVIEGTGTRIAPAITPPSEPAPRVMSLSLRTADSSANLGQTSNTVVTSEPPRFLVLPGNYSGDAWHIAGALLLDPDVCAVVPTKDEGRFSEITKQFSSFCETIPIPRCARRLLVAGKLTGRQMVSEANAGTQAKEMIDEHLKTLSLSSLDPVCGWTFASTSVIMHAVAMRGVKQVIEQLCRAFPKEPPKDLGYHALVDTINDAGPCVIVNMRRGVRDNHPQHNITPQIFNQLKSLIRGAGLGIVRVGKFQSKADTPGGEWMDELSIDEGDGPCIELFTPGRRDPREYTAWFWAQVGQLPKVRGVIGGRSGSLDIAAFMGMRTCCWDIADVKDHEYARLFIAFPLMSICRREKPTSWPTSYSPGKLLEEIDVRLWLSGHHVIPDHGGVLPKFAGSHLDDCCTLSRLTGSSGTETRHRLLMKPLPYLNAFLAKGESSGDESSAPPKDPEKERSALPKLGSGPIETEPELKACMACRTLTSRLQPCAAECKERIPVCHSCAAKPGLFCVAH